MQTFFALLTALEISVLVGAFTWAIQPYQEPVRIALSKGDRLSVKDQDKATNPPWPVRVVKTVSITKPVEKPRKSKKKRRDLVHHASKATE